MLHRKTGKSQGTPFLLLFSVLRGRVSPTPGIGGSSLIGRKRRSDETGDPDHIHPDVSREISSNTVCVWRTNSRRVSISSSNLMKPARLELDFCMGMRWLARRFGSPAQGQRPRACLRCAAARVDQSGKGPSRTRRRPASTLPASSRPAATPRSRRHSSPSPTQQTRPRCR